MPLHLVVLALLWVVVLWRTPAARYGARDASLWTALFGLAATMTLRESPVAHLVDHHTVPELSTLLKHCLCVIGAGGLLAFITAINKSHLDRAPIRRATAAAVILLAALFACVPRADAVSHGFLERHAGSPWTYAYLSVFLLYLAATMVAAAVLFASSSRDTAAPLLRFGLALLAAGTLITAGYAVFRLAFMAGGGSLMAPDTTRSINNVLAYGALACIVVGSSIPAGVVAWYRHQSSKHLRDLSPLRDELVASAAPLLTPDSSTDKSAWPRFSKCVVETYDAIRVLGHYAPETSRRQVRDVLDEMGPASNHPQMERAGWLHVARRRRQNGAKPEGADAPEATTPGGVDPFLYVDDLRQLQAAYFSPTAAAVADRVHHLEERNPS